MLSSVCTLCRPVGVEEPQSVSRHCQLCSHCVICPVVPCPSFCENLLPNKQMVPQSKVKVNALNMSDRVKI
jgi:hypothetical protein